MKLPLPFFLGAALLGAGCAVVPHEGNTVPAVHKQAAFDFNCPQDQLQIMELGENKYGAKGCNQRATYVVTSCSAMHDTCSVSRSGPIERD